MQPSTAAMVVKGEEVATSASLQERNEAKAKAKIKAQSEKVPTTARHQSPKGAWNHKLKDNEKETRKSRKDSPRETSVGKDFDMCEDDGAKEPPPSRSRALASERAPRALASGEEGGGEVRKTRRLGPRDQEREEEKAIEASKTREVATEEVPSEYSSDSSESSGKPSGEDKASPDEALRRREEDREARGRSQGETREKPRKERREKKHSDDDRRRASPRAGTEISSRSSRGRRAEREGSVEVDTRSEPSDRSADSDRGKRREGRKGGEEHRTSKSNKLQLTSQKERLRKPVFSKEDSQNMNAWTASASGKKTVEKLLAIQKENASEIGHLHALIDETHLVAREARENSLINQQEIAIIKKNNA